MLSIYDLPSVIFLFKCPENIWPGQVVSFYHFSLLSISFSRVFQGNVWSLVGHRVTKKDVDVPRKPDPGISVRIGILH